MEGRSTCGGVRSSVNWRGQASTSGTGLSTKRKKGCRKKNKDHNNRGGSLVCLPGN